MRTAGGDARQPEHDEPGGNGGGRARRQRLSRSESARRQARHARLAAEGRGERREQQRPPTTQRDTDGNTFRPLMKRARRKNNVPSQHATATAVRRSRPSSRSPPDAPAPAAAHARRAAAPPSPALPGGRAAGCRVSNASFRAATTTPVRRVSSSPNASPPGGQSRSASGAAGVLRTFAQRQIAARRRRYRECEATEEP